MLSQRLLRIVISTIDDQQNAPDSPDKHHKCSAKDFVLCNSIIEYQQQRWAASQPRGFRFLIQHHLLLAGLFECLPILKASLSLSLPPCVPRTREATTLVCVCLAVTNAANTMQSWDAFALLWHMSMNAMQQCDSRLGSRGPKSKTKPGSADAFPALTFFFLSKTELFFSFGTTLFFGPVWQVVA